MEAPVGSGVSVRRLAGFDDPDLPPVAWDRLLRSGGTDAVFLTRAWMRAWWETFGVGEPLLLLAERDGEPAALAPLYVDAGMVFFIGAGASDYLDFVGDGARPGVAAGLLGAAREAADGFVGFRLHHVPDGSPTGPALEEAAAELGLRRYDEGHLRAPALDMTDPETVEARLRKKSLRRHENWFEREGELQVLHLREAGEVLPRLEDFFDQHVRRWEETPYPSLFRDPAQRGLYRRLARAGGEAGWLRFTAVEWDGRPVAHHFGSCHRGSFLWYKPSFEVELARRSPGEVLLRNLLRAARDEAAHTFDFGLGEEAFKDRFATRARTVRTWGLYP